MDGNVDLEPKEGPSLVEEVFPVSVNLLEVRNYVGDVVLIKKQSPPLKFLLVVIDFQYKTPYKPPLVTNGDNPCGPLLASTKFRLNTNTIVEDSLLVSCLNI